MLLLPTAYVDYKCKKNKEKSPQTCTACGLNYEIFLLALAIYS